MSTGIGPVFLFLLFLCTCTTSGIKIISREEWGAQPPISRTVIPYKLMFVIIHHSESPGACFTTEDCKAKMRAIQDYHQRDQKWDDIGYNFVIGGDGNIYEGRGFNVVGAHAGVFNDKSIGICFIGNWTDIIPPSNMVEKNWELINYGVSAGHLVDNFTLYGHRQVRRTDCPGDEFFSLIEKWPHFSQLAIN